MIKKKSLCEQDTDKTVTNQKGTEWMTKYTDINGHALLSLILYLGSATVLLLLTQRGRTGETLTQFTGTARSSLISFSAPEFHGFDGQWS